MKSLSKVKGLFVKTCNFLVKNRNVVYATCITLILCMLWIFSIQIKTSAALLKGDSEKRIILKETSQAMDGANKALTMQNELIKLQRTVLDKRRQESSKMKEALKIQSDMIQRLIQHLKDLGEWPPRPLYDPDKIT